MIACEVPWFRFPRYPSNIPQQISHHSQAACIESVCLLVPVLLSLAIHVWDNNTADIVALGKHLHSSLFLIHNLR